MAIQVMPHTFISPVEEPERRMMSDGEDITAIITLYHRRRAHTCHRHSPVAAAGSLLPQIPHNLQENSAPVIIDQDIFGHTTN